MEVLFFGFSPLLILLLGEFFVVLCLQNEEKRRDLLSLAVLEIELAMVGLVFMVRLSVHKGFSFMVRLSVHKGCIGW